MTTKEKVVQREQLLDYVSIKDVFLTPELDHWCVGHEYLGPNWNDRGTVGRYFCESHDQYGFWLYLTDGSGEFHNVSERAIGASFHKINKLDNERRMSCSYSPHIPSYRSGKMDRLQKVAVLAGMFAATNIGIDMPARHLIRHMKNRVIRNVDYASMKAYSEECAEQFAAHVIESESQAETFRKEASGLWFDELNGMKDDYIKSIWPKHIEAYESV